MKNSAPSAAKHKIPSTALSWSPPKTASAQTVGEKAVKPAYKDKVTTTKQGLWRTGVAPDMLHAADVPTVSVKKEQPKTVHKKEGECYCNFCSTVRDGLKDIQLARANAKKSSHLWKLAASQDRRPSKSTAKFSKRNEDSESELDIRREALEEEDPPTPRNISLEALGVDPRAPRESEVKRVACHMMSIGEPSVTLAWLGLRSSPINIQLSESIV